MKMRVWWDGEEEPSEHEGDTREDCVIGAIEHARSWLREGILWCNKVEWIEDAEDQSNQPEA